MTQLLAAQRKVQVTASLSFHFCPLEITVCAVQWPWLLWITKCLPSFHYCSNLKLTGELLERGIKQPCPDTPAHDSTMDGCGPTCAIQKTLYGKPCSLKRSAHNRKLTTKERILVSKHWLKITQRPFYYVFAKKHFQGTCFLFFSIISRMKSLPWISLLRGNHFSSGGGRRGSSLCFPIGCHPSSDSSTQEPGRQKQFRQKPAVTWLFLASGS